MATRRAGHRGRKTKRAVDLAVRFKLRTDAGAVTTVTVNRPMPYCLELGITGYGDYLSEACHGFPIMLDFYDGKPRLLVWADINSEDPTHKIDLEGALESKRRISA